MRPPRRAKRPWPFSRSARRSSLSDHDQGGNLRLLADARRGLARQPRSAAGEAHRGHRPQPASRGPPAQRRRGRGGLRGVGARAPRALLVARPRPAHRRPGPPRSRSRGAGFRQRPRSRAAGRGHHWLRRSRAPLPARAASGRRGSGHRARGPRHRPRHRLQHRPHSGHRPSPDPRASRSPPALLGDLVLGRDRLSQARPGDLPAHPRRPRRRSATRRACGRQSGRRRHRRARGGDARRAPGGGRPLTRIWWSRICATWRSGSSAERGKGFWCCADRGQQVRSKPAMDVASLTAKIRDIKDFPTEGILFKDITTLLKDGVAWSSVIDHLTERYRSAKVEVVVGVESRGFIFGGALAQQLGAGFVPVRKKGKLPGPVIEEEYELEYGRDVLAIHQDAISSGQRVLAVDDLLATGGTMAATLKLIERLGGTVVACDFLIELAFLKGRERLQGYRVESLIRYE